MKKFLKWLLIIVVLLLALLLLFPILILLFIVWQVSTHPSKIISQIEPNLDFVDSNLEYIYYGNYKQNDNRDLYIGTIDGKTNNLISSDADLPYYYNYDKNKITFISNKKDKFKSFIKVYDLKNKITENVFEIDRQKYNGLFVAPQFSPDNTKLLYTINNKENNLDFTFIIDLVNKSTNLAFMIDEFATNGYSRWDINSKDIWVYQYKRQDNSDNYYKYINPLTNTDIKHYTNFDKITMAEIYGLKTGSNNLTKNSPFENRRDSEFVLKKADKVLVKYDSGIGIESVFNIEDFDYTKDMKYLIFTIGGKIYICDIDTGKIGYLTDGYYPRFVGDISSVNKPIKSFYDYY